MPTDMLQSPARSLARSYVAGAVACSVLLFGVLKLGWVATHVILPLTQWQARIAQATLGVPVLPIDVTLACSGADAFALCAGAIAAYPAAWRTRVGGIVAGFALIVTLNTVRIGTLGRAAASPMLFDALHVYIWPALLVVAIAGYVFGWMQWVNAHPPIAVPTAAGAAAPLPLPGRFAAWTLAFVVLFVATSSLYLNSITVLAMAAFVARAAAAALRVAGLHATASANILWTSRGGFEVTQECISTPLVPLYFAAVMTYGADWRWRAVGFAAGIPLFIALGIARLLVVAIPETIAGSPLFLIHAFYQILLGAVVVCIAVAWRRGVSSWRVALLACVAGAACTYGMGPVYEWGLSALAMPVPFDDAQGAMASMPAFQAGLFVALSIATLTALAWRRVAVGVATLALVQVVAFAVLHAISRYGDLTPHIRDVRAWAIVAPVAIVLTGVISHDRARR